MTRTLSSLALAVTTLASMALSPAAHAQATSAAQSSCMTAVNTKYGGRVKDLRVVHSEFSQANSLVIVEADGERWRCLSSNEGNVQELSKEQGSGHSAPDHGGAGGSSQGVTLYRDYGFRGASETIHGNVVDMKQTRIGHDALSSIRVPQGCSAILYSDNNYRGNSIELYGDEPELGRTRVGNDTVSSIKVSCGGQGSSHTGNSSGQSDQDFASLNGSRASSADDALRNWGFTDVDNFVRGNSRYTIWYKRASGQCVQMATADGRAVDVRNIYTHPACR